MQDPRAISELFTAAYGTQILTRGAKIIQRPGWYQVLSPGSPGPQRNEVIHSAMREHEAEQIIDQVLAEYKNIPTAFKWCTSPLSKPINLPELLTRKGFSSWRSRDMYFDIGEAPLLTAEKLKIEKVEAGNLGDYVDTYLKGWILDRAATALEKQHLEEDLRWSFEHHAGKAHYYLARTGDDCVGTAGLFLKEHSGYLTGANVLKEHRGKGYYRSLIDKRLGEILRSGRNLAITGARESTSAPALEKYGFKTAFRCSIYQFGAPLPE